MGFVHPDQSRLKIVQRTRSSKHINKNKMAFDPEKDADLMISYHVFQFGNLLNIGLMVTMATIR